MNDYVVKVYSSFFRVRATNESDACRLAREEMNEMCGDMGEVDGVWLLKGVGDGEARYLGYEDDSGWEIIESL